MTRKKSFGLQNNLPLLISLLAIVFIIPLTVFAVTFQKVFLTVSAAAIK